MVISENQHIDQFSFRNLNSYTMSTENIFRPIMDQAINDLTMYVSRVGGKPWLLLHKDFEPRIMLLCGGQYLGQKFCKISYIEDIKQTDAEGPPVIAVCANDPQYVNTTLSAFKKLPNHSRHMLIIPRYGALAQKAVEDSGLDGHIFVHEFHYDVLGIETYQFLVPAPHCFRNVFIDGNIDDLYGICRALVKIEILNGVYAERVKHLLHEMKAQIDFSAFSAQQTFSSLIVIDRTADLYTPLMTPFTYGGIIDDTLNPPLGILHLPDSIPKELLDGKRDIILNDSDEVFKNIRFLRLPEAADYTQTQLSDINNIKKDLQDNKNGTMDMSLFKAKALRARALASMKPMLSLHLSLMAHLGTIKQTEEGFKEAIEYELQTLLGLEQTPDLADSFVLRDKKWTEALRLYCFTSLFRRGFPASALLTIRRRFVNKFGFEFLHDIENLERVGLLTQQAGFLQFTNRTPSWEQVRDAFTLMVDANNKDDLGSFYDGYVPLSARLVQYSISGEIKKGTKIKVLNGLGAPVELPKPTKKTEVDENLSPEGKSTTKKIMVFVIGGMTESEVCVIRDMGKRLYQGSVEFYVGTTSIISGKRLLEETCPLLLKA